MSRWNNALNNVMTAVLTLCALVVTALVLRRELRPTPAPTAGDYTIPGRYIPGADAYREPSTTLSIGQSLTIVEFSDFQCPFCATASTQLKALEAQFPGRINIQYRHLPIGQIHAHARKAALAAECAAEQRAFPEFASALFAQQGRIGQRSWHDFARAAGVADVSAFQRCVEIERWATRVRQDSAAAAELGIDATPTFLVGDSLYVGLPTIRQMTEWVERAN